MNVVDSLADGRSRSQTPARTPDPDDHRHKEDLGELIQIAENRGAEQEMDEVMGILGRKDSKLASLKTPASARRVLLLRSRLHNYIVRNLRECDLSWETPERDIAFYSHFFKLVRELMVRCFFHPGYDDSLLQVLQAHDQTTDIREFERALIDPSPVGTDHQRRPLDYLPVYIQSCIE